MMNKSQLNLQYLPIQQQKLFSGFGHEFHVVLFPNNWNYSSWQNMPLSEIEIVVTEDNAIDSSLIASVIDESKFPCRATFQTNVKDTLSYLHEEYSSEINRGFLLLVDLLLPSESGFELLGIIRSSPEFKLIPACVISASQNIRDVNRAMKLGAVSFMTKPRDLEQFRKLSRAFDELIDVLYGPALSSNRIELPAST